MWGKEEHAQQCTTKEPPSGEEKPQYSQTTQKQLSTIHFNLPTHIEEKKLEMISPDITMLWKRIWKELSPDDHKRYDDQAASSLEQHEVEMVKWGVEH